MPYDIHARCPYSTIAEDVAAKSAWDTFLAALKSATAHKIDAGGTIIGGKIQTGDEVTGSHQRQGDVW
jgi:hypothetical protein